MKLTTDLLKKLAIATSNHCTGNDNYVYDVIIAELTKSSYPTEILEKAIIKCFSMPNELPKVSSIIEGIDELRGTTFNYMPFCKAAVTRDPGYLLTNETMTTLSADTHFVLANLAEQYFILDLTHTANPLSTYDTENVVLYNSAYYTVLLQKEISELCSTINHQNVWYDEFVKESLTLGRLSHTRKKNLIEELCAMFHTFTTEIAAYTNGSYDVAYGNIKNMVKHRFRSWKCARPAYEAAMLLEQVFRFGGQMMQVMSECRSIDIALDEAPFDPDLEYLKPTMVRMCYQH